MFEADLHRQVRLATLAGCGIAAVMLATAASAGEAGSCRMPDRLAAISAVGGIRAPDPRRQACTPSASTIAVLAIHSVDDPVNVYDGDPATSPAYWMHGVEDAMAGWAEHLGCVGIETMAVTQNVERREYRGCGTPGALTLNALRGSGHTWPGSSFAFPDYLGATEVNIDATVLSLDWFERHRRAGNPGS